MQRSSLFLMWHWHAPHLLTVPFPLHDTLPLLCDVLYPGTREAIYIAGLALQNAKPPFCHLHSVEYPKVNALLTVIDLLVLNFCQRCPVLWTVFLVKLFSLYFFLLSSSCNRNLSQRAHLHLTRLPGLFCTYHCIQQYLYPSWQIYILYFSILVFPASINRSVSTNVPENNIFYPCPSFSLFHLLPSVGEVVVWYSQRTNFVCSFDPCIKEVLHLKHMGSSDTPSSAGYIVISIISLLPTPLIHVQLITIKGGERDRSSFICMHELSFQDITLWGARWWQKLCCWSGILSHDYIEQWSRPEKSVVSSCAYFLCFTEMGIFSALCFLTTGDGWNWNNIHSSLLSSIQPRFWFIFLKHNFFQVLPISILTITMQTNLYCVQC